jgi:hypothetical protein
VGPFDPDAMPVFSESPGAVFQESAKYDPRQVHFPPPSVAVEESGEPPIGAFSILETVQMMHNKFSRQGSGGAAAAGEGAGAGREDKKENVLTEEEENSRKERRRLSLAKLRTQKTSVSEAVMFGRGDDEEEVDDSFDMFPSQSRNRKARDKSPGKGDKGGGRGLMGGLQEAVLKRRAMLDAKSPSFRGSSRNLGASSRNLGGGGGGDEEVVSSSSPPGPGRLAKGESFRAGPGVNPLLKSRSAGDSALLSRRDLMGGAGKQQSIRLTGPHHNIDTAGSNVDNSSSQRPGQMVRQPSILQKLFTKKSDNGSNSPMRNMGSPQKSSSNLNI